MINLSTTESSIIFTFTDSNHYLTGDGTINVPKSSLSLITDDSQMATFRKAPSNDIFVSAPYSEFGKTKAELIEWFEENGFSDGGGVTPEDVEQMIDDAVIPIENDVETISGDVQTLSGNVSTLSGDVASISGDVQTISGDVQSISGDVQSISGDVSIISGDVQTLSGNVNTLNGNVNTLSDDVQTLSGNVSTLSGNVNTLSGEVATKVEQSDFDDLKDEIIDNERVISETFVAVSGAIDDNAAAISGKADTSAVTAVEQALSGKANVSDVYTKAETDAAITSAISEIQLSGYVETEVFDQKEEAIAHALTDLHENKADKSEIPDMDDYVTNDKFNLLKAQVSDQAINKADVTYVDNAIADVEQTIEDNERVTAQAFVSINNRLGGLSFVALTQAAYDALTTKDSNTIYFIKDNS